MAASEVVKISPNIPDSALEPVSLYNHTHKHGGENGGGGDDMLERVKKLEEQMASLVTDVAVIKSNYATKEDLHKEIGAQTKWIAATIIGTTGLALAVAKYLFS
ncbi:hemolysin XhlA [Edwardsiella tarda]|uniref:hemolysin XhlA n=1 Tax=Edwardsiella tarda TaxID=636 RepID=UPI003A83F651